MTTYPLVFNIGPLEVTGYGLMMMVGFLTGGWAISRELRRRGLNEEYASDIVVAAVIGAIIRVRHDEDAAVYFNGLRKRVPTRVTFELVAPALAVGYALGRVGCFLVQDDYGVPTNLPWGMRFPEGLPPTNALQLNSDFGVPIPEGMNPLEVLAVHPTQLYEAAAMLLAFWSVH